MYAPIRQSDLGLVRGCFVEREFKKFFEYSSPEEGEVSPFPGYPDKIWAGPNGEFRWASVCSTVARIVVDEDDDGPVVDRWVISRHRRYEL